IGAAIGAIVGILILVWGARTYAYARAHESTDNAQVDGRILPVLAKVGGYVQAVSARENEPIGAGALLVAIDDAEYRDRLSQAEAELQVAAASFGANGSTGQSQAMVLTASS